jgi:hypothetical protein
VHHWNWNNKIHFINNFLLYHTLFITRFRNKFYVKRTHAKYAFNQEWLISNTIKHIWISAKCINLQIFVAIF